MTYIARYVFKGGDELPLEVPRPTPEEWDEFRDRLIDQKEWSPTEKEWEEFMSWVREEVDREGSWEDYLQEETRPEPSIQ